MSTRDIRPGLDLMRWYDTVTVHMVRDTDTTAPLCGAVRPAHAGGSLVGPYADHWTGYSGDDSILSRCVSCATEAERLSQTCDIDLSPEVSVQHHCPRMREHIEHAFNSGRRGTPHPDDLPIPCPDCYSIVVTSVRIPWQPPRKFTTQEEA